MQTWELEYTVFMHGCTFVCKITCRSSRITKLTHTPKILLYVYLYVHTNRRKGLLLMQNSLTHIWLNFAGLVTYVYTQMDNLASVRIYAHLHLSQLRFICVWTLTANAYTGVLTFLSSSHLKVTKAYVSLGIILILTGFNPNPTSRFLNCYTHKHTDKHTWTIM